MSEVISSVSVQIDPLILVDQIVHHVDIRWVSVPVKFSILSTVKLCLFTFPRLRWREQGGLAWL